MLPHFLRCDLFVKAEDLSLGDSRQVVYRDHRHVLGWKKGFGV